MLVKIPNVLSQEDVKEMRSLMEGSEWTDGNVTSGFQAAKQKNNLQLPEGSEAARQLGDHILAVLSQNGVFMSAALPLKIFPPLFNCYQSGQSFGVHVDNAIRQVPGTPVKIRTDISMTLFLSDPDEYDGGELLIEDTYGSQSIKLTAGDMVLYPSTSLHRVAPVTKGRRFASFFWLQSMVNSDERRALLFELDTAIQSLNTAFDAKPNQDNNDKVNLEIMRLTGVYHNLLRQWVET
jgi:PKHD-type hydroxylase